MADLSITNTNVSAAAGAVIGKGTAGATINAGQVVYQDTGDSNEMKLADCNGTGDQLVVAGVAINTAADGQPISWIISGTLTIGAAATRGEVYFCSATAGGIMPDADLASGNNVNYIGVGNSAGNLVVNIHNSGVAIA